MKRSESQPISSVLEEFFKDNPQLTDRIAETRLKASWGKLLGTSVAAYTTTMYIKNRCLYVRLTSAVVKNELLYCREQLVKNLNASVDREVITDIIFL